MKIFGFNISRDESPVKKRETPISSVVWGDPDVNGPTVSNAYQQVVWVYRAINAIAEQVANIPFRFSRRHGDKLITSGPLLDFYARPHPRLNRFQYWELRIVWLMLRGECFRVPVFDEQRRLRSILLLDPAHMEHVVDNGMLVGWRYRDYRRDAPLASQVLLPEEVWHERLPNPFDPWRGLAPLALATVSAQTEYASALHMRGIMENNGDAGLIIRTSEQLDPEQRDQLLEACAARKRRGRADRPLLLWAGTELVTPKLTSADKEFLSTRRYARAEICAAFGVPEEIVTATDNAKYDVMTGTRLNFIENRVVPLCRRLEAEEAVTVEAIDPAAVGWFDCEDHPVLTEARRTRLAAAKEAFDMGVPFNDVNKTFDLGFKPLPWGDIGYLPSTMTRVGSRVES